MVPLATLEESVDSLLDTHTHTHTLFLPYHLCFHPELAINYPPTCVILSCSLVPAEPTDSITEAARIVIQEVKEKNRRECVTN